MSVGQLTPTLPWMLSVFLSLHWEWGWNLTDWKNLLQGGLIWETLIEENQENSLIISFERN